MLFVRNTFIVNLNTDVTVPVIFYSESQATAHHATLSMQAWRLSILQNQVVGHRAPYRIKSDMEESAGC